MMGLSGWNGMDFYISIIIIATALGLLLYERIS